MLPDRQLLSHVTPHLTGGNRPAGNQRFDPAVLDIIVELLCSRDIASGDLIRDALDALFTDHWNVRIWMDLMVFTSAYIAMALTPKDSLPVVVTSPVVVTQLGCNVDYACVGILFPQTTMHGIVQGLHNDNHRSTFVSGSSSLASPARHSVQIYDK